jgi:purine-binding chemotaxis protein CheW
MAVTTPPDRAREPRRENERAASPPRTTKPLARTFEADEPRGEGVEPLLVFRVGDLWLGLPAHVVDQLHSVPVSTPVPLAPAHIVGLAILRGEVVPLLDLERFLELDVAPAAPDDAEADRPLGAATRRVAVISAAGMQVGVLCREVRGIVPLQAPAQPGLKVARGRVLEKVAAAEISTDDGVLVVLDPIRLLEEARVRS